MNPYLQFVDEIARVTLGGRSLPLGGLVPPRHPAPAASAPAALIFSPHPDDECIVGGLALRLMREARVRVTNIAVTLGSNLARRQERWQELSAACNFLGFGLEATVPGGLERITSQARLQDPRHWAAAVNSVVALLARHRPHLVFLPHQGDWNASHIGTHYLVMDALKRLPPDFETILVETEFWAAMSAPNLMVEFSAADLADLLAALSFHVGEVKRNPYHLRLPAWMQDNVRRGAELVGGQGSVAPDYAFATLYRVRQWAAGTAKDPCPEGTRIGAHDFPGALFGLTR